MTQSTTGHGLALGGVEPRTRAYWSEPGSAPRLRQEHWRLLCLVGLGVAAAALVGYATAQNPAARPAHIAVAVRVVIILALLLAGAYAQIAARRVRIGMLLVAASLFSGLWLLNGSSHPTLFAIGRLCAGLAPGVFAYLLLAYPSGRLGRHDRRVMLSVGGAIFVLSTLMVLTTAQPMLKTPLVACGPHCPQNPLFLGSTADSVQSLMKAGFWAALSLLACAVPVLLGARLRSGAEPRRRSFIPLVLVAVVNTVFWLGFVISQMAGWSTDGAFGAAYVETAALVPVAIVAGLFVERLSMGRALARFASRLAEHPEAAPDVVLGQMLEDPSLTMSFYDPRTGVDVDSSGRPLRSPAGGENHAVARITRNGSPIATVYYDADLADQAEFVEAAGAVALMHIEATRLETDLSETNRELAASRRRLVDAAATERQRLERDLHDGVQQHILGLRLRLDRATETIHEDPPLGEQMLAAIGRQVDDLLSELRSFAAGIYPSVLTERGLKDALESAVRNAPRPIEIHTHGLSRYREDIEVAVYFCCLEAMQNYAKYAGRHAEAKLRVWQIGDSLAFDVRDTGPGFDLEASAGGHGLVNMRDRIEAVGGRLWISSRKGRGTWVRGRVPVG